MPNRCDGLKICKLKKFQGDPFPVITLFLKGYNLNKPRCQLTDKVYKNMFEYDNAITAKSGVLKTVIRWSNLQFGKSIFISTQ